MQIMPGFRTIVVQGQPAIVADAPGDALTIQAINGITAVAAPSTDTIQIYPTYGTTANTVCQGNDSRIAAPRPPSAHANTHGASGSDAIRLDQLAPPLDIATLNASTVAHGLLPKLSGNTAQYLNGAGVWAGVAAGPGTFLNVKDYGATGNGITDDSAAIQSALAAAASLGRVVYVPCGTYIIGTTLQRPADVSIVGESMVGSILVWSPLANTVGVILDTVDASLNRCTISNLTFTKRWDITAQTTGILGGSSLAQYNSAICTFENLLFSKLTYGIRGNGSPAGVGIFDCYFKNVWCSECFFGLWPFGSGNRYDHCRIVFCDTGIAFDYLNAESFDGGLVTGSVFILNTYDVGIRSANGVRPIKFVGSWFEQSGAGIMYIPNPNTRVMNLDFFGCMLSTSSTVGMFNVINAKGAVSVDRCTIIQGGASASMAFLHPSDATSTLSITGCVQYDVTGAESVINAIGGTGNYTIYDKANSRFEWYIAGVRRAYIDAAGFHNG